MRSGLQHYEFASLLQREHDLVNLLQEIWEILLVPDQQSSLGRRIEQMLVRCRRLRPLGRPRNTYSVR
jgi:hypothetical protein